MIADICIVAQAVPPVFSQVPDVSSIHEISAGNRVFAFCIPD